MARTSIDRQQPLVEPHNDNNADHVAYLPKRPGWEGIRRDQGSRGRTWRGPVLGLFFRERQQEEELKREKERGEVAKRWRRHEREGQRREIERAARSERREIDNGEGIERRRMGLRCGEGIECGERSKRGEIERGESGSEIWAATVCYDTSYERARPAS